MPYKVLAKKSVLKNINKLPAHIQQQKLVLLIDDLKDNGPVAHHCQTTAGSRENAPY